MARLCLVSLYLVALYPGMAAAGADITVAQAPSAGTRVITLGTAGGPLPRKDRAQPSNLLTVGDALYLIDAGDGVTRRIAQAGYDFGQIHKVFITHAHG